MTSYFGLIYFALIDFTERKTSIVFFVAFKSLNIQLFLSKDQLIFSITITIN